MDKLRVAAETTWNEAVQGLIVRKRRLCGPLIAMSIDGIENAEADGLG